jgi:SsrA-binding protein
MSIAQNKKAFFDYFIEDKFEAGIVLEGWEVKAIRDNRANLKEAYVIIQRGEIYLIGCHVTPMGAASTHIRPDAIRTRKLLLHNEEIIKLIEKVDRAGYTIVPLDMHFSKGRIKVQIGLAKGKKQHDKRDTEKARKYLLKKLIDHPELATDVDMEWRSGLLQPENIHGITSQTYLHTKHTPQSWRFVLAFFLAGASVSSSSLRLPVAIALDFLPLSMMLAPSRIRSAALLAISASPKEA